MRMRVIQRVLDIFPLPLFLLFLFSKKCQIVRQIWQGNKEPKLSCIYIKICYSKNAKFAFELLYRRGSKAEKRIYTSPVREGLESHLISTTSTFSHIINHRRLIKEYLESHLLSTHYQDVRTKLRANQQQDTRSHSTFTTFYLFTNASDIPEVTHLSTKALAMGHCL